MSIKPCSDDPLWLQPFTFDGWKLPVQQPAPDISAARAKLHERTADYLECQGADDRAAREKNRATWWRGISQSSERRARKLCDEASSTAVEAVEILLAHAEDSNVPAIEPLADLYVVLKSILQNLHHLAATGRRDAANILLRTLYEATDHFRALAFTQPELFKDAARRMYGIPGIISPHLEKGEDNQKLIQLLEVGQSHYFDIVPTGKKGKRWKLNSTEANLWAARLYQYVEDARSSYDLLQIMEQNERFVIPGWLHKAVKLPVFSVATHSEWAESIWEVVIEATNGKPESEPSLYQLGKSAESRKRKWSKTTTDKTRATDVRGKIKLRLREALEQMAGIRSIPR